MNALQSWLALRGRGFSLRLNTLARVLQLAVTVLTAAFSRSSYNKATRLVIEKQIYFTAWQILPGFAAFSALFSFLIIDIVASAGREYGLYEYSLELIVRVLILEILPLMTALFVEPSLKFLQATQPRSYASPPPDCPACGS